MASSANFALPASLADRGLWHLRARTLEAALELVRARWRIEFRSFESWRSGLGHAGVQPGADLGEAGQLAAHVVRADARLPLAFKCLPRAMALSAMLTRRGIAHQVVLAVRPQGGRGKPDDLHAWVRVEGETVIGALPGPWREVLAIPQKTAEELASAGNTGNRRGRKVASGE